MTAPRSGPGQPVSPSRGQGSLRSSGFRPRVPRLACPSPCCPDAGGGRPPGVSCLSPSSGVPNPPPVSLPPPLPGAPAKGVPLPVVAAAQGSQGPGSEKCRQGPALQEGPPPAACYPPGFQGFRRPRAPPDSASPTLSTPASLSTGPRWARFRAPRGLWGPQPWAGVGSESPSCKPSDPCCAARRGGASGLSGSRGVRHRWLLEERPAGPGAPPGQGRGQAPSLGGQGRASERRALAGHPWAQAVPLKAEGTHLPCLLTQGPSTTQGGVPLAVPCPGGPWATCQPQCTHLPQGAA